MGSELGVDTFVSVDGWAGSDGLPGYFVYSGPELEEWIRSQAMTGCRDNLRFRTNNEN